MSDTKTMGAGKHQIMDLININPLIDYDREASHVESVIKFLSFLMLDATNGSVTLDEDQAHGLAFLLDTCEAALRVMRHNGEGVA